MPSSNVAMWCSLRDQPSPPRSTALSHRARLQSLCCRWPTKLPTALLDTLTTPTNLLCWLQAIDNLHRVTVCVHCHRAVGPLSAQLARRAELAELELPLEPPFCQVCTRLTEGSWKWLGGGQAVECEAGCGEVYCSEQCRADSKAQGHALLCVGESTEEDPMFVHKVIRCQLSLHRDTCVGARDGNE